MSVIEKTIIGVVEDNPGITTEELNIKLSSENKLSKELLSTLPGVITVMANSNKIKVIIVSNIHLKDGTSLRTKAFLYPIDVDIELLNKI